VFPIGVATVGTAASVLTDSPQFWQKDISSAFAVPHFLQNITITFLHYFFFISPLAASFI
jgi:hypothetical protein